MVHVALTNQKLRQRGIRILEEAAGVSASTAEHTLRQAGHDLPAALVMLETGASVKSAQRALARTDGNVREALQIVAKQRIRSKGRA
jgi:N-acetylmuramic acid 6-phosphate etherase